MENDDPEPADTSLEEFVDAEITVEGADTPADEQTLHHALSRLDGVRTLSIAGGKVAVEYEPTRITKAQLAEEITQAGFTVREVESSVASPVIEALREIEER